MNTSHTITRKRYLSFGPASPRLAAGVRLARRAWSLVVLPYTLTAAWIEGAPGMPCRLACISLGLRALLRGDISRALRLITDPMDSFRYFEVEFAARVARDQPIQNYLDVSSPRLVPIMVLKQHRSAVSDLLNPLEQDLAETAALTASLGLSARCTLHTAFIEHAGLAPESFDLITSISVVEHIPDDSQAIASMWRLLRPNGKLVLTIPCAREACDEYTDLDEYALFSKDEKGFVYWQRYYDEEALAKRIWSITGRPTSMKILGERRPGSYDDNVRRKRTDPTYPYWREPIMMAREYSLFPSFDDLPGMGVVAMEFTKASR
jgi:SAM-dependent methyltransferase